MSGVEEAAALLWRRPWRHKVFDAHRRRLLSSASVDDDDEDDDDDDDDSENTVNDDVSVAETEKWKIILYRFRVCLSFETRFGLLVCEGTKGWKEWRDGRDGEREGERRRESVFAGRL